MALLSHPQQAPPGAVVEEWNGRKGRLALRGRPMGLRLSSQLVLGPSSLCPWRTPLRAPLPRLLMKPFVLSPLQDARRRSGRTVHLEWGKIVSEI